VVLTETQAGPAKTAPSIRSWRLRRDVVGEVVLVAVLAIVTIAVLRHQALAQAFSVDESRWIATSRYFWITFVDRDVLGPEWQPSYIVLTHPPVARYVIGFGLWLQGWSPDELNGRYDTDRSRQYNRLAGNIPSRALLDAARRVALVFAVGATMLLYPIGRGLAGPAAGAAAVLLALANPLLSTLWTRALAESVLAFFSLLTLLLAMRVAAAIDRGERRFGLWVGLGVAAGLAVATKLTGALVGAAVASFALVRQIARHPPDRAWAGFGPWVDAGLAAILTFILVNPLVYPDPIVRTAMLFEHRRDEMQQQALGTPRLAVPDDVRTRAALTYRRTFLDYGTFQAWLGVALDLALAAGGLGVTLVATWRSWRRRCPLGPPTLLLCWTLTTYVVSVANLGFDSSHYFALPETIAVLLEALALATVLRLALSSLPLRALQRSAS
jgi:4-amino-4-deoxy-L-arabinose transferase-like glycosyltransferase